MMSRRGVADRAITEGIELLPAVAKHKNLFFHSSWAKYDLARVGTLRLAPGGTYLEHLRRDYASMESMFFGARPTFDELFAELESLEVRINQLDADAE